MPFLTGLTFLWLDVHYFNSMPEENPTALTWTFSLQFQDPDDQDPEIAQARSIAAAPFVQYLGFHIVEHATTQAQYIRGVLRCHKPRSLLQLRAVLSLPSYKPYRGLFSKSVVDRKLHPRHRRSQLFEFGEIVPSTNKRPIACTGLCPCCCTSNKRPNVSPYFLFQFILLA